MVNLVREAKDSFNGFISYFTANNVNVFDYFSASGSVADIYWGSPSNLLNYSIESSSRLDQWASLYNDPVVNFSFKCPILLTHYRFRVRLDDPSYFLLSWKIEALLSDNSWTTIDTKIDREELKSLRAAYTFECDLPKVVKQIKITGTKITNAKYLVLSKVEFFGSLDLSQCPSLYKRLKIFCNTQLNKRIFLPVHLYSLIFINI